VDDPAEQVRVAASVGKLRARVGAERRGHYGLGGIVGTIGVRVVPAVHDPGGHCQQLLDGDRLGPGGRGRGEVAEMAQEWVAQAEQALGFGDAHGD
jgi:hypothetical protein